VLVAAAILMLIAKLALGAELTPDTPSPADSLLRVARVAADERRFDDAAADLHRALAERPGDRTIGSLLARVLSWDRRYDESLEAYRALLAAHPDDAYDRAGYARVLAWSGRHAESVREFRRAVAADSTNLETRVGLARVLAWSGDLPGARAEYRRIERANPAYGDAWVGEASVVRWRGADPSVLDEERAAIDRALAPSLALGWTTAHEMQRASGGPDFTIEETGPYLLGRAVLGRALELTARAARTTLHQTNTRPAPGDTTLDYDLTSRSLRAEATLRRGYPIQASVAGEWRVFDARSPKALYPLSGDDAFTGWSARVWGDAGRVTPSLTARRTFVALKGADPVTGALRFEPGDLTDVEGALAWQWNARGSASAFATRGEYSDDNRRWRAGGAVGYRVRAGRPNVRVEYALSFADWDARSPSYFTPLASTRHAASVALSGYAEPGAVDYGLRWEISRLASSNFEDIVANAFSGYWNATVAGRFPVGIEGAWSTDDNDYRTWYLGLFGAVRW
jgi:tetratricopeptide (TPR) repeat protein